MKNSFKAFLIYFLAIFVSITAIISCSNLSDEKSTSIIVNFGNARTVQSYSEKDLSYYIVSINPKVQEDVKVDIENGDTKARFDELDEGTYSILVKAFNKENTLIADGSNSVQVKSGETSQVSIKMNPKDYEVEDKEDDTQTVIGGNDKEDETTETPDDKEDDEHQSTIGGGDRNDDGNQGTVENKPVPEITITGDGTYTLSKTDNIFATVTATISNAEKSDYLWGLWVKNEISYTDSETLKSFATDEYLISEFKTEYAITLVEGENNFVFILIYKDNDGTFKCIQKNIIVTGTYETLKSFEVSYEYDDNGFTTYSENITNGIKITETYSDNSVSTGNKENYEIKPLGDYDENSVGTFAYKVEYTGTNAIENKTQYVTVDVKKNFSLPNIEITASQNRGSLTSPIILSFTEKDCSYTSWTYSQNQATSSEIEITKSYLWRNFGETVTRESSSNVTSYGSYTLEITYDSNNEYLILPENKTATSNIINISEVTYQNDKADSSQVPSSFLTISGETLNESDIPTLSADGFEFIGWYSDSTYKTQVTTDTAITSNTTLYAKWEEVKITPTIEITFSNEDLSLGNTNSSIPKGQSLTFTITRDYKTVSWYVAETLQGNNNSNTFIFTGTEKGVYEILVSATDNNGIERTASVQVEVTE